MPIAYVPSPLDLKIPSVRAEFEYINDGLERAIDTQNLDMYNDYMAKMQKFYRKYLGRDFV